MDSLNTIGAFLAEYWPALLLLAVIITIPKLLLIWGMVRNPQITMLSWAGLMILSGLWGQSITIELTHARESFIFWVWACALTITGPGMMATSIYQRERIHLAMGISLVAFNAVWVAPLSLAWLTLNWALVGFGIAFYIALFVLDRRAATPHLPDYMQLEEPRDEPMGFTRASLPSR